MILPVPSLPTSNFYCCKKLLVSILNPFSATKLAAAAAAAGPSARPHRWSHSQMEWSTATAVTCRRYPRKDNHQGNHQQQQQKQKIVVIMGATGSGKSRLSIDLATRFFPSEIINSDKMQVYQTLDITTNKIPMHERLGVPHHLIGDVDPSDHPELTPSEFRSLAASSISGIASRRKLPLIVGGSNSFIYALASNRFDPGSDVFHETCPDSVCSELRYNCCFLWVDVAMPVLNQYLVKRVDDMLESGMFEELAEYFKSEDFSESDSVNRTGLRKAIGVPELEPYFRRFPPGSADVSPNEDPVRRAAYDEAVRSIKENTCQLAKRQVGKIERLRSAGWDLRRVAATEAFRAAMGLDGSDFAEKTSEIWERQVVQPSVKIVKRFLEG